MALVAAAIQKEMEAMIASALTSEFSKEGAADPTSHKKTAAAIAKGVTQVLIKHLTSSAQVLPGIATAGSPAAQVTTTPGMIF